MPQPDKSNATFQAGCLTRTLVPRPTRFTPVRFDSEAPRTPASILHSADETSYDIDLFLFDSNGRQAGSSTSGDRNWEEISVTGSTDPMVATAGIPAGEWTVEVRGWLVVAPEPFTGTFSVTHP